MVYATEEGRAMRIVLDVFAEHYEQIMMRVERKTRLHSVLMNAVVVYHRERESRRKVVKVLCDETGAALILEAAKTLCPEAIQEIEESLARTSIFV
jgi:hypothetical protein